MVNLVDSHAHLNLLDDPAAALAASRKAGVRQVIAVGIDLPSSHEAVEFAVNNQDVLAAVGIHPHEAANVDDNALLELGSLIAESGRVVAVGETGLDFYRDRSPRESQKAAFISQIELARGAGLPLIVHSREAEAETLPLLEKHADGLTVILHCFSLYQHVDLCAERGYYMSLAGNVTFANAGVLREAALRIPESLLLTETDSPYLSPVPHRGTVNEPANVRFVLEEIAHLRSERPDVLAKQIYRNFLAAFSLTSTT